VDASTMTGLGKVGAAMAVSFGAFGSALGIGAAGQAAVGAWKRAYAQNKPAPFILMAFIGAPLSQTIYGMILMTNLLNVAAQQPEKWLPLLAAGLFGGMAIGLPAWAQGTIGAACADALGETGKGFGNYLIAVGVIETVSIFVLIFILGVFR